MGFIQTHSNASENPDFTNKKLIENFFLKQLYNIKYWDIFWNLILPFFFLQVTLIDKDDGFKLAMMKAAKNFDLPTLLVLCERALIASVSIKNCIKLYTTAEEIGAKELQDHCSQLISSHWVRITNWKQNTKNCPKMFYWKRILNFHELFYQPRIFCVYLLSPWFFSYKESDWLKIRSVLFHVPFLPLHKIGQR